MLNIDDVLEILSTPLLGIIPESQEVLRASNVGSPVTLCNTVSAPARAYFDAARRLGEANGPSCPFHRCNVPQLASRRFTVDGACGPALRNIEYGSLAARQLYPEIRQSRPEKMPLSPVIGTDAPVQYEPSAEPGIRRHMPTNGGTSDADPGAV